MILQNDKVFERNVCKIKEEDEWYLHIFSRSYAPGWQPWTQRHGRKIGVMTSFLPSIQAHVPHVRNNIEFFYWEKINCTELYLIFYFAELIAFLFSIILLATHFLLSDLASTSSMKPAKLDKTFCWKTGNS